MDENCYIKKSNQDIKNVPRFDDYKLKNNIMNENSFLICFAYVIELINKHITMYYIIFLYKAILKNLS